MYSAHCSVVRCLCVPVWLSVCPPFVTLPYGVRPETNIIEILSAPGESRIVLIITELRRVSKFSDGAKVRPYVAFRNNVRVLYVRYGKMYVPVRVCTRTVKYNYIL